MPKETNRTIRIKQAIVTLMKERSDWDSRRLRKSCLDAIGGGDAKERARLGNSIRRILTQLLELGVLASGEGDGITVGPAFETLAGELAAMPSDSENTFSESEKLQTAPAKDKETKKPKERDMRLFLSELLSSGAHAEGEIV